MTTSSTLKLYQIRYDYSDKQEAQRVLGIKQQQLRNDTRILLELNVPGFDYIRYSDKGYTRRSLTVLCEFRKLAKIVGRKRAIDSIYDYMIQYWENYSDESN